MAIGIGNEIERLHSLGLLDPLLKNRTTEENIVWGTSHYRKHGKRYGEDQQITTSLITGRHSGIIQSRTGKDIASQADRTKSYAEVFTPASVCSLMIDYADMQWFEIPDSEYGMELPPVEERDIPQSKTWQDYVLFRCLELTCGEAPFLVMRYDATTGDAIEIPDRMGILDRKLRMVRKYAKSEEWLEWVFKSFESVYGYEFQGDSVVIARINMLLEFEETLQVMLGRFPSEAEYQRVIEICTWNLIQMDGLTGCPPFVQAKFEQSVLFGDSEDVLPDQLCMMYDWGEMYQKALKGNRTMKFDFIIGNPPYQDEALGNNGTFSPPIYDKFMDAVFPLADQVELIHPARFLFNAGNTPKGWNKKMLEDEHLKVIHYEPVSKKIFPKNDISGGVAVTLHDSTKKIGPIGAFVHLKELASIKEKVVGHASFKSLMDIVLSRTSYRLTDVLHREHPEALGMLSNGHPYDMSSNIFEVLPQVFYDKMPVDGLNYVQIYGREGGIRKYKYIRADYVNRSVVNFEKYKIFVPGANGSGALGEVLSTPLIGWPLIGLPLIGHTETFISIGNFDTNIEAEACLKYVKTKFARTMLGLLKITQANPPYKWKYVPIQNFASSSDIDWSKPIHEIDVQLYDKYGLSDEERKFIEEKVTAME